MELLVNLDVDDLAKGIGFYTSAFGLRIGRRFGTAGVELIGGSSAIYLLAKADGSSPARTAGDRRTYKRHWTPVHLDFVVDDIDAAVERAVAAGATLEDSIATQQWGRLALMGDPFGHGF